MVNNTTHLVTVPNGVLLFSVILKFFAMGIGVTGNIVVIICNLFMKKEKTSTSYLIANLGLADLLVCLTVYPIWLVEFILTILDVNSNQTLFCKLSRSCSWTLLFVSIATLFAITVDQYFFIVKPLKYPAIVTPRRVVAGVLGIWLTACGVFTMHEQMYHSHLNFRSLCFEQEYISWSYAAFAGYIPLLLLFILNFKIFTVAKIHRKQILAQKTVIHKPETTNKLSNNLFVDLHRSLQAWKGAKTFAIIVVVLAFCCLIPTVIAMILMRHCSDTCQQIWFVVIHYELYGINSIVNPFIYGMRHTKYRKAYSRIISKLLSCKLSGS